MAKSKTSDVKLASSEKSPPAHRWGYPDADGVRACAKPGCTVRVADSYRRWQRKPGAHWRDQLRELIPDCAGASVPAQSTLSAPRFRWSIVKAPAGDPLKRTWPIVGLTAESYRAELHGECFRALRVECGLSLGDVARAWGVSVVEVFELERGLRRFPAAADLWAALQQLWCWGSERNRDALYEDSPTAHPKMPRAAQQHESGDGDERICRDCADDVCDCSARRGEVDRG